MQMHGKWVTKGTSREEGSLLWRSRNLYTHLMSTLSPEGKVNYYDNVLSCEMALLRKRL